MKSAIPERSTGDTTLGVAFYVNQTRDSIFFTQGSTYNSANPPPGWPLPPIVLDLLIAAGQGLPSGFTYLKLRESDRQRCGAFPGRSAE